MNAALRADVRRNGAAALGVDVGDDDFRAFGGKALRDRTAEAGTGAGDQRHLAEQAGSSAALFAVDRHGQFDQRRDAPAQMTILASQQRIARAAKTFGVGEHPRQNQVFADGRRPQRRKSFSRDVSLQTIALLSLVLPAAGLVVEFRQFVAVADDQRHPHIGTFLDGPADGLEQMIARWPRSSRGRLAR